jgi:hypothetical protein
MDRFRTITLFSEVPPARRGPSGVVVSALVHAALLFLSVAYLKNTARVADSLAKQRYLVTWFHVQQPQIRRSRSGGSLGGSPHVAAPVTRAVDPGGHPSSTLIHSVAKPARAPQTVVQPDLPPSVLPVNEMPLPQILIWSATHTPTATITPNPAQAANTPITRPSLQAPNEQLKITSLLIAPNISGPSSLTLPPSTTTPLVVHRPSLPPQIASSASVTDAPATPARVISLSETKLERGTIALPPLNEVGTPSGVDDPATEKVLAAESGTGTGTQDAKGAGAETGERGGNRVAQSGAGSPSATGAPTQQTATGGSGNGTGGNGSTANDGRGSGRGLDQGAGNGSSITELRQPADGQFSAVVVGSSISDRYPETMELWAGRLTYTVYIHVGRTKNWILQYAVTHDSSGSASSAQPNAPWPYLMELPHLAPGDIDSNALIVHGLLNVSGHFEALKVLFPSDFSQGKFVLSALEQWRFRPARQDGKLVAVEVLLIIPEEEDEEPAKKANAGN